MEDQVVANVDWRKCPGRAVILEDLSNGILSLDAIETSTEEAWDLYRDREEFRGVPFSQFKRQLKAHREQVRKRQRKAQHGEELDDPSGEHEGEADDRNVDWLRCAAREIILEDLREGRLSLLEEETSTEEAWEHYQLLTEFDLVPFLQFKRQLKAHRQQVTKLIEISMPQEYALAHDRKLFPLQGTKRNGEQKFYLTKAAALLRADVKKDLHAGLTPSQFRLKREEYSKRSCGLSLKQFKERIYQEIRYRKYVNWLNMKRDELFGKVAKKKDSRKRKKQTTEQTTQNKRNH